MNWSGTSDDRSADDRAFKKESTAIVAVPNESPNLRKVRRGTKIRATIFLFFGLALSLGVLVFGYYLDYKGQYPNETWVQYFTGPVIGRYYRTMLESILDVDKFMGEIGQCIVVAACLAGWALIFAPRRAKEVPPPQRLWVYVLVVTIGLFAFGLVGSLGFYGWQHPDLDIHFPLWEGFYPNHFSAHILPLVAFIFGFIPLFYLIGRARLRAQWQVNYVGWACLCGGLALFQFQLAFSSLDVGYLVTNEILISAVVYLSATFIFIGVVIFWQTRTARQSSRSLQDIPRKIPRLFFLAMILLLLAVGGTLIIVSPFQTMESDLLLSHFLPITFTVLLALSLYWFGESHKKLGAKWQ